MRHLDKMTADCGRGQCPHPGTRYGEVQTEESFPLSDQTEILGKESRVSARQSIMDNASTSTNNYMRGFVPYAIAAAVLSLCGGFTAAAPSAIASDWELGGIGTTWITLAFALGSAGMAPIMGKVGDMIGRRAAILLGLAIMGIGELLIGIAPHGAFAFVLVARFILGTGAAAIAPVVIGYILTEFPPDKTGKGFAIYMLVASSMVIFGPTAGGLIISMYGWRPVLYICAAFCAIGVVISFFTVKKSAAPR